MSGGSFFTIPPLPLSPRQPPFIGGGYLESKYADEFRCRKVKPDRVDPEGLSIEPDPNTLVLSHVLPNLPNLANREQTDTRQFVASSLPASLDDTFDDLDRV